MALEHAILVALTEKPGSGYELARRFERSIGFFWSATHQQIYKVLGRMEKDGWVSVDAVAQTGRPDKKVYDISAAGRVELRRWIAEPVDFAVPRYDLAVKIRGASQGDLPALVAEVKGHRDAFATRLEAYLQFEKRDAPDPSALHG